MNFRLTRGLRARSQGRAEPSLVPGEGAFDLPALMINAFEEPLLHLPAIARGGPLARASGVDRDDRLGHVQLLAGDLVVGLRIKRRIGQQAVPPKRFRPCAQQRDQLRRVVRRAQPQMKGHPQMGVAFAQGGELGPLPHARFLAFGKLPAVVRADVSRLEARGIHDRFGQDRQEVASPGAATQSLLDQVKSPFFSRRWAAF